MKFLSKIICLLLILLPIVDFLYKWQDETSSPALYLRGGVLLLLLLSMAVNHHRTFHNNNLIIKSVWLLLGYILFITFCFYVGINTLYDVIRVVFALVGLLVFYKLFQTNILSEKEMIRFFFILILILTTITFMNLGYRLNSRKELREADNVGYALLCVYASIMLFANKKVFPVALFCIMIGTLISGKRGAVIGLIVASLPLIKYVFFNRQWKGLKKMFFSILLVVGVVVALRLFGDYVSATLERFRMLEEDQGSGRGDILKYYWAHYKESDLLHQIFGHGLFAGTWNSGSTFAFNSKMAHNDWAELLYDFGIIGVLIYVILFVRMFLILYKNRKHKTEYYFMFEMTAIIWFLSSVFSSTFLMNINSIYLYMTAAYAISKLEQQKNVRATNPT